MKLKKIFKIIKNSKRVDVLNVSGAVIFALDSCIYSAKDMPALLSDEEFGAVFEIEPDKLSGFDIHIDSETERQRAFLSIDRGVPLEKLGSFCFGGLSCVLFKKAEQRQLTLEGSYSSAENDFSGYIAVDPAMLTPISDGIISFEYIQFLGGGCVCAFENGSPVAVVRPRVIDPESIEHIREICEGLGAYYARE